MRSSARPSDEISDILADQQNVSFGNDGPFPGPPRPERAIPQMDRSQQSTNRGIVAVFGRYSIFLNNVMSSFSENATTPKIPRERRSSQLQGKREGRIYRRTSLLPRASRLFPPTSLLPTPQCTFMRVVPRVVSGERCVTDPKRVTPTHLPTHPIPSSSSSSSSQKGCYPGCYPRRSRIAR